MSDVCRIDQKTADALLGAPVDLINLNGGTSPQQTKALLSLQQLKAMDDWEKVVVGLPNKTGYVCNIYTLSNHIVVHINGLISQMEIVDRESMVRAYKSAMKDIKQHDPEELFQKMNSGTDTDLLRWQQFSYLCLSCACWQHVLYGTPLHAWADDEVLPSAKRAARERGRLNEIPYTLGIGDLLNRSRPSTFSPSAPPAPALKELEELEDDDVLHIDMKQLIGQEFMIQTSRATVQGHYNACWYTFHRHLDFAEKVYNQHMATLTSSDLYQDRRKTYDQCMMLVMLSRVLYNKPIPLCHPDKMKCTHPHCTGACKVAEKLTRIIWDPTPEMLYKILMPTGAAAAKREFIIAGDFRPGFGTEVVHLKFSDFKPHEEIMLHLREKGDNAMLALSMSHTAFIEGLVIMKKQAMSNKAYARQGLLYLEKTCKIPDHSTFKDEVRTDDPTAGAKLRELAGNRARMVYLRHVLYGTPIRLYYSSYNPSETETGGSIERRYLELVYKICMRKLVAGNEPSHQ